MRDSNASRASVDTVPTTVAGWDGESADDEPDTTAATVVSPPRLRATGNSPSRNPALWALIGLATFVAVVVGALACGFGARRPPADRRPEETRSATTAGTVLTSPSIQATRGTTTTTPTTATAQPPPTELPPAASPAATCADLEARRQQIDEGKHQVEETYRDDPDTREALKRELEDQKQAIDAQRRSLGC